MPLFNLGQGSFVPEASTVTFDSFDLGTENPVVTLDVPDIGTVEVSFGTNFEGQASTLLKDGVFTLSDSNPNGPLSLDSEAAPVFTANDGSADTNPVLSGTPTFNGPISVLFSEPVAAVGLTGGSFDAVESTSIEAFDENGNSLGLVRNTQTGFEFFGLATDDEANDIAGISFYITDNEPAGFEIDNLTFGTIAQVEATLSITSEQAVLTEGSEGTTAYSFTVERNGAVSGETTVNYNVVGAGENPASEADFVDSVFPSGTLTFAPDETEKTITVEVAADTEVEADEKFEVTLSEATGGAIGLPTAESIIQDDDEDAPASLEPNDTIEEATPTNLSFNNPGTFTLSGEIGNNPNIDAGLDVDVYEFDLAAGDQVTVDIDAEVNGANLDSVVQIFDELGDRVAANDDEFEADTFDSLLTYNPIFSGTYYAVVSGFGNSEYDVFSEGSGSSGSTGEYDIAIDVAGVEAAPDEPNDQLETAIATELSSENTGDFNFSGSIGDNTDLAAQGLDVDLLQVQLNAGDRLTATIDTIDLEAPTIDASILRIFDSNGNEFKLQPSFDQQLNSVGASIEFVADVSDNYFVGVSGFANFDYDPSNPGSGEVGQTGDYNLELTVSNPSENNEPNDTIPNATLIQEAINTTGEFSSAGFLGNNSELDDPNLDVDMYSLSLQQGESISIDIDTPDTSNLNPILRVFNSNGGEVAFNNDNIAGGEVESADPFLNFTAPFSSQYYIGVSDLNNDFYSAFASETGLEAGATGSYNIEINSTNVTPEALEDPTNDILDTAVTLNLEEGVGSVEGVIGDHPDFPTVPGLDVDLYQVELGANERIAIEIAAETLKSPLDSNLRFFDSEGTEIAFNDDFNGLDPFIQLEVEAAGTYFIGVSGQGNDSYDPEEAGSGNDPFASTGEYTLNVENLGVAVEAGPEEPNDTIANATATDLTPENLGSFRFADGAIGDNPDLEDVSLDVDIFQVELAENSLLTADINTGELESDLDSVVQIFDSEGQLITFNDDQNIDTLDAFLEFSPETEGTYYIGVSGLGNNGDEGYNPNQAGSGTTGGSQGSYELELQLEELPVEDPTNDTIDTAVATGLNRDNPGSTTKSGIIGDNDAVDAAGLDVDLYAVSLKLGDSLDVNVESQVLGSELDSYLRVFNADGAPVEGAFDDDSGEFEDSQLTFTPDTNGTFYVGVSGFGNIDYDATSAGSGEEAGTTGEYEITLNLTPGTPAVATPDELSTEEGAVLENNLLSNDSGDGLLITAINEASENLGGEVTTDQDALLTVNEDGTFSYNPNGQFEALENGESATDSFTYTVTDAVGQTAQTTATITILGVTPEATVDAVEDELTTEEQTILESNVLENDQPETGISVTAVNGNTENLATEITTQAGALLTLDAEGNLIYDQNGQFDDLNDGGEGTDTFTYTITDDNGETDQTTVNLTIAGVTQFEEVRPTANNDIELTGSDSPVTIDVLDNDFSNDDFGNLEITDFEASTSKGGSVALDESGEKLVYTPDPEFSGEDSFSYTIANESGGFDEATVNLTVNPFDPNVNVELELRELDDEPGLIIGEEFLMDVRFRDLVTEENPGEAVVSGYADIFFDPNVLQIVGDESNDDDGLSVNGIIHADSYNGFRKGTVDNVQGIADEAGGFFPGAAPGNLPDDNTVFTVQMKATGGGDAQIIGTTTVGSNAGEANNSAITILSQLADQRGNTNFGGLELETVNPNITAMEVSTSFEDLDGNAIDSVNVGDEFNIVLSAKDLRSEGDKLGVFSAFADVNYDTVLADVTDIQLAGAFASPVIDLAEAINDDEGLLDEVGGTNSDLTPVESDTPQRFAVITATAQAQGELEVTTDVGDGPTSFNTLFGLDNAVNSGTDYFGGSLTIDIAPPEANADEVTTNEETVLDGNLLNNDEGVELNVTAVNEDSEAIGATIETEAGALVTVNGDGTFTYDPNEQFDSLVFGDSDTDSFTYTVTDRAEQTAQATVTVTIEGVGDPADAIDDSLTVEEGAIVESGTVNVLDNDTGESPLIIDSVNGSAENVGTEFTTEKGALVTLTEDGNLTYNTNGAFEVLNQGETDSDSFTYTIIDDDGTTDEATVNLTINGVGTPDLVVTSFDAATDHVLGAETTVNFTVENQGKAPSPGFQVEILYYTSDNTEQLNEQLNNEEGEVVKTLAFEELAGGEPITASSEVSLPVETLLAEALADDPSIFGEEVPETGNFASNNVDYVGIRIVDDDSTGEEEEAFANNGVTGEEGVNVDDIAYFPWDLLNQAAEGVNQGGPDDLISNGEVEQVDFNAVAQNIGRLINENVIEAPDSGLDLERIDLDLDGAISPVDAVRVANRVGYQINSNIFEDDANSELFEEFNAVTEEGVA